MPPERAGGGFTRRIIMFGFEKTPYDVKVYEEKLKDFLPDTMVDVHTHVWKKEFFDYAHIDGCVDWVKLVADECYIDDLLQTYKDMFPGKTVYPVLMGEPTANVYKTNVYTKECMDKTGLPGLLCTEYRMTPEYLEEEIATKGFLGLKPYLSNCAPYIPADEIRIFDFLPKEHLEVANKHGWIVMLHIARPGRLKDPVNIAQLMDIEEKYPNVKLVVAHIGRAYSPEDIGDAFETLKHTKNMMFDFTANTLSLAMEKCIEAVGTDRVMFGSDLPITKMRMYRITKNGTYYNVIPRGLYGDVSNDYHMIESDEENISNFMYEELLAFKKCSETLGLSKEDVKKILCTNGANLYKIKI